MLCTRKKKITAFVLVLALCLSLLTLCAAAEGHSMLPSVPGKARPGYPEMRVYMLSKLAGRAYRIHDEVCMSLGELSALYDIDFDIQVTDSGFTALTEGLTLSAAAEAQYMTANHRYIFLPNSFFPFGDDVYLPLDAIRRVFGIDAEIVGDERIDISTKQYRFITGSEDYYRLHMSAEYQYWLPRIIAIETVDEPMAGKIGVGNVILNRVKSPRYPDTIYRVLYDNNTGVQFAPATTGALKAKLEDEESRIAACLVYEGYNTVEDSLFFANPENNGDYWFRNNCILVVTIGRHEFFK